MARRRLRWPSESGAGKFRVTNVEEKPYTSKPYPPFTTSTLQQEANRKLGFTARRTMQVAQSLYENGHITYMRTDSTNLAQVAIDDARRLVAEEYGNEYLPAEARVYKSKVKNCARGARRHSPGRSSVRIAGRCCVISLNADEFKIFDMIWKRTIASQMADARGRRTTITIEGEGCVFQVSGKTIDFPGYLRAYVEGSDTPEAELADQETVLPSVTVGESLKCSDMTAKEHSTQAPSRYSEAALDQSARRTRHRSARAHMPRSSTRSRTATMPSRKAARWCRLGSRSPSSNCWSSIWPAWSITSSRRRWKTTWTRSAAASRNTSIT